MSTVYFTDRDLGARIFPDALEEAGLRVARHDDHFPDHATPDTVWLREIAERGWVAVSGNQDILRQPLEIAALRRFRARLLIVVGTHVPALERARNFVNTLPKIERLLATMEPPAIAKVYRARAGEIAVERFATA